MFVTTANTLRMPQPLMDRMEIIRLPGYTEDEKVEIAKRHLIPKQVKAHGLKKIEWNISDDALRDLIRYYTREAGVRNLERELGKMLRKVATKLASGERTAPVVVEKDDVRGWLGRAHFFFEAADRTSVPGVVTGLAVTGAGGDVLFVEASVSDGPEGLTLTGQLGDVMKESAEIALSYVRSHAEELGIDPGAFTGKRFHVHVPAGAVPKDGPSAGVTMTTALVSLLRDVPVRSVVGMTGEVTLQGRVLPIGGVKQKVLAAHRAGLTEVVLPERNGPDLEDVPEEVRDVMTFHLAATIADVLSPALSGPGTTAAASEEGNGLGAAA
jgi:ATP-dependent Lon protease